MACDVVWVSGWEIQCCGEPFSVGGTVHWKVATTRSADWLDDRFRTVSRSRPTYQYSGHGVEGSDEMTFDLIGDVVSIDALHHALHAEFDSNIGGVVRAPTPGTARLTSVESDLRWELEPPPDIKAESFAGWIVEVEVASLDPVRDEDPVAREQERRPARAVARAVTEYMARRMKKAHDE